MNFPTKILKHPAKNYGPYNFSTNRLIQFELPPNMPIDLSMCKLEVDITKLSDTGKESTWGYNLADDGGFLPVDAIFDRIELKRTNYLQNGGIIDQMDQSCLYANTKHYADDWTNKNSMSSQGEYVYDNRIKSSIFKVGSTVTYQMDLADKLDFFKQSFMKDDKGKPDKQLYLTDSTTYLNLELNNNYNLRVVRSDPYDLTMVKAGAGSVVNIIVPNQDSYYAAGGTPVYSRNLADSEILIPFANTAYANAGAAQGAGLETGAKVLFTYQDYAGNTHNNNYNYNKIWLSLSGDAVAGAVATNMSLPIAGQTVIADLPTAGTGVTITNCVLNFPDPTKILQLVDFTSTADGKITGQTVALNDLATARYADLAALNAKIKSGDRVQLCFTDPRTNLNKPLSKCFNLTVNTVTEAGGVYSIKFIEDLVVGTVSTKMQGCHIVLGESLNMTLNNANLILYHKVMSLPRQIKPIEYWSSVLQRYDMPKDSKYFNIEIPKLYDNCFLIVLLCPMLNQVNSVNDNLDSYSISVNGILKYNSDIVVNSPAYNYLLRKNLLEVLPEGVKVLSQNNNITSNKISTIITERLMPGIDTAFSVQLKSTTGMTQKTVYLYQLCLKSYSAN